MQIKQPLNLVTVFDGEKKQPNTYTIKIKQLGDKIRGKIMQSMRQFTWNVLTNNSNIQNKTTNYANYTNVNHWLDHCSILYVIYHFFDK